MPGYVRLMTSIGRRAAAALVAICALVACASPAVAGAAGEPQITSAGIDASDRLYATWTLAPGTTFEGMDFSSSSILDELLDYAEFIDTESTAGFVCMPPPGFCDGTATQTTYRENDRVSRDRRYFVIVRAERGDETLASQVWVIDEAKPVLHGIGRASQTPTNTPVVGVPYVPPPRNTVPAATFKLLAPVPKTIAGFVSRGLRVRVTCPLFECYGAVLLALGRTEVFDFGTVRPDGRRTFVVRANKALRARLRGRQRVRLRLTINISQPNRKETEIVRGIELRR